MQSLTKLLCALAPLVLTAAPNSVTENSSYGKIPAYFEQNLGQAGAGTLFLSRAGGYTFALESGGAGLYAGGQAGIRLEFAGSNRRAVVTAEDRLEGHSNYYSGNDPRKWITGVPQFGRVRYSRIYPGVDLVWHASARQIEYDLELAPGADAAQIRARFAGAEAISIADNGDLILKTKGGEIRQLAPAVWQERDGQRVRVEARYKLLADGGVGVRLAKYDRSRALTIDPVLTYGTYFSGSGYDTLYAVAADANGSAYVIGNSNTADFPGTTSGSPSSSTLFLAKLNSAGTGLSYMTYLTPTQYYDSDSLNAIAVDQNGNAFVGGVSESLPVTPGAFQTSSGYNGTGYVAKFDASGSIVFGTFLGSVSLSNFNTTVLGLAVSSSGYVYVTGRTAASDFPVSPNAYQKTAASAGYNGGHAFVSVFNNTGTGLFYSTYLAGSDLDQGNSIAVDGSGNIFVAGQTDSPDFPITAGAFQSQLKVQDGFISKFNASGGLVYSTFLGGSGYDSISGIAADGSGNAYVGGTSGSTDFPTTAGAFNPTAQEGPFVAKLNPTGSSLIYSTMLGSNPNAYFNSYTFGGIALANDGSVFAAGSTVVPTFPTTPGALISVLPNVNGESGLPFLLQLSPDGSTLIYSTFVAGTQFTGYQNQTFMSVALDPSGNAYLAVNTIQPDMPTTLSAYEPSTLDTSGQVGYIAKIDMPSPVFCSVVLSPSNVELPGYGATASFNLTVPTGCPWEAVPSNGITITSATKGTVSGTVSFTVGVNNSTVASQTGTIQFGPSIFTVVQDAGNCAAPVFTPASLDFTNEGGLRDISVALPSPCPNNAVPSAGWIQVTPSGTQAGSGAIGVFAGPNDFGPRSGFVTIGGQQVAITQDGGACTSTVTAPGTQVAAAGGTGTLQITTNTPSCTWGAYGAPAWIQINEISPTGQGNANLAYVVAPNITASARSATLNVAGQTVTISQAAGPVSNMPASYAAAVFAGTNQCCNGSGPLGDGEPANTVVLNGPQGLLWSNGNLYIADPYNGRVREVTPDGLISTVAGGGSAQSGTATSVNLGSPNSLAMGSDGSLYVTDNSPTGRVWKINNGTATVVAGNQTNGSTDVLDYPQGVAVDSSNNLYISDSYEDRVRELSSGSITTIAGATGTCGAGGDGGPASAATFCAPLGLALDGNYGLLVADESNHRVRVIANGAINTFAGGGPQTPPAANVYLPATTLGMVYPDQLAVDSIANNVYITDSNNVWRLITWNNGTLPTPLMAQITGGSTGISLRSAAGVAADAAGNVYVADSAAVWKLTPNYSFCAINPGGNGSLTLLPANGAAGVVLNPILTWSAITGATSYNVYFGTSNPPALATSSTCTSYSPSTLAPSTTYYWQIVPQGTGLSPSPVQSFTTQMDGAGTVTLTLLVSGSGTATASPSSPNGIYYPGTQVCLTATPSSGWTFSNWTGVTLDGSGCFTINSNATATAVFTSTAAGPELFLQNQSNNGVSTWFMGGANNATIESGPWFATAAANWKLAAVADMNGDGVPDLIFQNSSTNQISIWFMTGVNGLTIGTAPIIYTAAPNWKVICAADMNGDGVPDLIFQNSATNQISIWFMNAGGMSFSNAPVIATSAAGWKLATAGDINQDGQNDLIFQNQSTGALSVWFMNAGGMTYSSAPIVAHPAVGWTLAAVRDFNGDGIADYIFQNRATGQVSVWYLTGNQGSSYSSAPIIATAAAGWYVLGAH